MTFLTARPYEAGQVSEFSPGESPRQRDAPHDPALGDHHCLIRPARNQCEIDHAADIRRRHILHERITVRGGCRLRGRRIASPHDQRRYCYNTEDREDGKPAPGPTAGMPLCHSRTLADLYVPPACSGVTDAFGER